MAATKSFMVMSPTTIRVALFGLNQVSWKSRRDARASSFTDCSVPEPVKGLL